MKKTYIEPLVQLASVETQEFIAASSLDGQQDSDNPSVSLTEHEYSGEGASRRGSFWDDED